MSFMTIVRNLRARALALFTGASLLAASTVQAAPFDVSDAVTAVTENVPNIVTFGIAVISALAVVKILNIVKLA